MAKYDPLENQCKTTFSAGTVTESPFGIPDYIQIYFTLPGEDERSEYYVPWKYHCPGGDEATDASEAYTAGDIVLVECDENGYPTRVVGHADGAEPCNIVYAAAWYASNQVYLKYNEKNRYFDIANAIRLKYVEYDQVSHWEGINGCISIQFADNYPYRFVTVVEVNPSASGELAGYFVQGRYAIVDCVVDLDNQWEPFTYNVYFYGLHKVYDDYPYWEDRLVCNCDGEGIPSESEDDTEHACGIAFSNPCTAESQHACQCTTKWDNEECHCTGDYDCCRDYDPYNCATDLWCCKPTICSEVSYIWHSNDDPTCVDCKCIPAPIGTYATQEGIPTIYLAGAAGYSDGWYTQDRSSGTECSTPLDGCGCGEGCGSPTPITYVHTEYLTDCTVPITRDALVWEKAINAVAADPEWNGVFDLGTPESFSIADPSDTWTHYEMGFGSCGPDGCDRGKSYQYVFYAGRCMGNQKWTYGLTHRTVEDLPDPILAGCTCTTVEEETWTVAQILVGFSYSFPGTPDGESDGAWEFMNNMLKEDLQSLCYAWVDGASVTHYRTTNPLGSDLELDDDLDSPFDNPSTTACLVSDVNNSGFLIGGGKVRAFAGFEINGENGKIRPVGEYLYTWDVGFGGTTLQRNGAFMVYQEPVG